MPHVHCRTFVVADPTDLLREIAQMPVLYFDNPTMGQVEGMDLLERILHLAQYHGRGVVFHADELGPTLVKYFWLSTSSALSLLSTPEGTNTLYLHLSGFVPDEEEFVVHYLHEITHGLWSMGEVRSTNGASCLIEFELSGESEFALLSKVLHGAFFGLCRDGFQQRLSRRGNPQG